VVVGAGHVNFQGLNSARLDININPQLNRAIINWQSFSIDRGEVTSINQGANAFTLNRVVSGDPTAIYGQLKAAQGGVMVVNPNGIVVHQGGSVDVAGMLTLSTLDISNKDFLNGGSNRFYGDSRTGVTNFGTITSADGDVVLMGGFVDNQGQIGALNGTVAIGAGGDILLQEGAAGAKISVRGASDYEGTGINNSGTIRGASAELKAHGNVYALAINNGGTIRASGADRRNGRVLLRASGGSSNINLGSRSSVETAAAGDGGTVGVESVGGTVTVAGRVDANGGRSGGTVSVVGRSVQQTAESAVEARGDSAGGTVAIDATDSLFLAGEVSTSAAFGTGGRIDLTGTSIRINDSADVSADGLSSGGRIRVGGDFQGQDTGLREADSVRVLGGASLTADSAAGDAGRVIAWSNGAMEFFGDVSASAAGAVGDGGLVEVSGKRDLRFDGTARVGSVGGRVGSVLFDPGNVTVGGAGSTVTVSSINDTLQSGAHVFIVTESGDITFNSLGGGGSTAALTDATAIANANNRHTAIQWTNSESSFAAFASGSIYVNNHIRTSGGGSVNLIAGWGGLESDATLSAYDPQGAWDVYIGQGRFGVNGGSVIVGSSSMDRHVEVGSRFGDTNVAGYDVRVSASGTAASNRHAMIGFRDSGQVFAPVLDKGGNFRLDMRVGAPTGTGNWLLSDGKNSANMAAAGTGDPIVGVAGRYEVDVNSDGIVDGVNGINSTGRVTESFIPYANHFNSVDSGNWWWQQIEATGNPGTKDPLGLGGLRPENGAGRAADRADINVLARNSVTLTAGAGLEQNVAMIGHGGPNRSNVTGSGTSIREVGSEDPSVAAFSNAAIQGNQLERRWSINGSIADINATSIARLAPVYGNINVLGGVNTSSLIAVNRAEGSVLASFGPTGNVVLRANQTFKTTGPSSNSPAQIGHGGIGQSGEFFGDIRVETGGSVTLQAGEATRSAAVIGHTFYAHSYWNPTSVADQQIRFFATAGDYDNTNLRRGELFSGRVTTGYDPLIDPARTVRYTLANYTLTGAPGTYAVVVTPGNTGNFIPEVVTGNLTGRFQNLNQPTEFINMNPLLYSQGLAAGGAFGTAANSQGRGSVAPLTLAPVGPEVVPGLHGSVPTGLHGDIRVAARNGDITLTGYSTNGVTGDLGRDSRFAAIGHGGTNANNIAGLGSGYQNLSQGSPTVPGMNSAGVVTGNVEGREIVDLRINTVGNQVGGSGSRSEIGGVGSAVNRGFVFMSITGDIDAEAGRDLIMTAGNDVQDHTRLGHGGAGPDGGTLADYETSSFILGDIRVRTGRDLTLTGGGSVTNVTRGGNFAMRAWAQLGHGGRRTGFLGFLGDIDVRTGGNVQLTNGAHTWNYAKIGHQGVEDLGQSGGSFVREEHFIADLAQTTIASNLNATTASVVYSSVTGGLNLTRNFTATGAGTLVGAARNTADVSVNAGGGVLLTHLQEGFRQPVGRPGTFGDPDSQDAGVLTRDSYAQIGHGGLNLTTYLTTFSNNTAYNYPGKIGDVSVTAQGGNVTLQNGTGQQRWTRIGHGVGVNDRVIDNGNIGASRAIELAGDISVTASGNIDVNADFANENERIENTDALFGSANPSRWNPVAIGHGAIVNNGDVVVLGKGELIGGIPSSSNITIDAAGNLTVLGGKGTEASFGQIGHGFASAQGGDTSRRLGVSTGFAGDIGVRVGGDALVKGNDNAWSEAPGGQDNLGISVLGAFGAIGHGGYQLDAPSSGNISVYVGRDLNVIAQQRTDPGTTTPFPGGTYSIINLSIGSDAVAGAFNFAKIGHFAVENGDRLTTVADAVTGARMDGSITVVANRNISVLGGTTPNVDTQTIFGSFAQIGHGGPAIQGDLDGDITVLAGGDLAVTAGTERATGAITVRDINNYAMIGNGDYLRDTNANASYVFNSSATGNRFGDINIATGGSARFDGALIGHADPRVSGLDPTETEGVTRIAVSRLNPFYGGRGGLFAVDGTIFSSGGVGRERMQFFMPSRSMNFMSANTRINETTATFSTAPRDFEAPFVKANGALAGRADEVYLAPDLWWDQAGQGAALGVSGGGVFPSDASGSHGGAIATVNSPGGLPGLAALAPGTLGSSATTYRDSNGVSGTGLYTLYYDAIEAALLPPVVPVVPPVVPAVTPPPIVFDFFGLAFEETYDAFFREDDLFNGVGGEGSGLYPLLGLFERDETLVEESDEWRAEDALDNLFGDRRDSNSEEEQDEERASRIARGQAGGPVGMSFYVFEPGTNRYSSYRVFGYQVGTFIPTE
jgi:filamentous hemagglutinin family protein